MKIFGKKISKKLLIGIIIILLIIGGGVTMGVILMNNKGNQKQEEKQKDTILLKEDLKFEINSEVKLLSLVSEDNKVKILSEDDTIDTSTLGEKEITIKYEVEEKEETKTFKITIEDTEAPTIEYQKELSTNVGSKIDLLKGVKVSDNSKEEIKATIEGDYNFDKEGTYNLKYVAIDSSNNKKEEEFTLKVNKKSTTSNNNNKPQTNNNSNKNNNTSDKTTNEISSDNKNCKQATKNQWEFISDYSEQKYCGEHLRYYINFAWNPISKTDGDGNDVGAMELYKMEISYANGNPFNSKEKLQIVGIPITEYNSDVFNWIKKHASSIIPKNDYSNEKITCSNGVEYGIDGVPCKVNYTHETQVKMLLIYTGRPE